MRIPISAYTNIHVYTYCHLCMYAYIYTKLAVAIPPNTTITSGNLMAIDSVVSCLLHTSESVDYVENLDVLRAILTEWKELFST